MVSTLGWIAVGILGYWLVLAWLRREELLPDYVGTQGPITTLHTQRGKRFLDWLAGPKRFWRAWANVGVGTALVVMVGAFLMLLAIAIDTIRNPPEPTGINQPRNVLVIPGVNDFLPLTAAPGIVFGLLVGLVVHEGGHGLLCRVEDIEIDSMGVALFTFLPIGAFVEPDEESRDRAGRGGQTRMFAAGVTNNFALTAVAFALLFGPVAGSIAVAPGVAVHGVLPGSAAAAAGIDGGDRITAVAGQPVGNETDLEATLADIEDRTVRVELDGDSTATVNRSLLVTGNVPPAPADVPVGSTITHVNGTPVHTRAAFYAALRNASGPVTVRWTNDGTAKTSTFPAGTYVTVIEGGPFAEDGGPAGTSIVITRIDGERVLTFEAIGDALADADPGDTVRVVAYVDGERIVYEVTLGRDDEGEAFLGIRGVAPGVTGLTVSDFGIRTYPAGSYLAAIGGGDGADGASGSLFGTFLGKMFLVLLLPVAGAMPGQFLPYNFPGFTPDVLGFYVVQGPLGALGGALFLIANMLFWTGWINVQLGFFNCIPAFPLDGGHILRASTEAVLSRLPVETTRRQVRAVTTTVGVTMLVSFLVVILWPQFVAA